MKKRTRDSVPFYETVKILPNYAVYFYRPVDFHRSETKLPALNKHTGSISDKAATKIRNAINWMLLFTERKYVYSKAENQTFSFLLNFITLTLPSDQKHTDEYVKTEMLVPFIQWLTKTQKCIMWLWKAESQINGNIHFHITTHQFVHWKSIRAKWNSICAKHGYCKVFQDGSNDKGNSATQVKAAKNAQQVGGYLAGYIGKKDTLTVKLKTPKWWPKVKHKVKSDTILNYTYGKGTPLKRPITGRLWACSNNIANINCFASEFTHTGMEMLDLQEDFESIVTDIKTEKFYTLLFYPNEGLQNLPSTITLNILEHKPKQKQQTQFTVESLMN